MDDILKYISSREFLAWLSEYFRRIGIRTSWVVEQSSIDYAMVHGGHEIDVKLHGAYHPDPPSEVDREIGESDASFRRRLLAHGDTSSDREFFDVKNKDGSPFILRVDKAKQDDMHNELTAKIKSLEDQLLQQKIKSKIRGTYVSDNKAMFYGFLEFLKKQKVDMNATNDEILNSYIDQLVGGKDE